MNKDVSGSLIEVIKMKFVFLKFFTITFYTGTTVQTIIIKTITFTYYHPTN